MTTYATGRIGRRYPPGEPSRSTRAGRPQGTTAGNPLSDFMAAHGVTIWTLSDKSGVSPRTISYLRGCAHSPRIGTARRLAKALSALLGRDVAVADVFDLRGGEPR